MAFLEELKRRKVLRMAVTYIVAGWVLVEVAATLEQALELPGWFDKFIISALLLGFPIALILSWHFDIRRDTPEPLPKSERAAVLFALAVVLMLLGGAGYIYLYFQNSGSDHGAKLGAPTIAVLPFADFSPGGDQGWFADGISEEILNVLARTQGLQVASRTASFHYRGGETDLATAAAELRVATILEGSVRTQGDRLRITAQLISAEDGFHLWSETYDRERDDIFAVQDEIAVSIATALLGELGVASLPEDRFTGTRNAEAYEYYLRGRTHLNRASLPDRLSAEAEFSRALELDENFVEALVGLAWVQLNQAMLGLRDGSMGALQRALSIKPDHPLAIAVLARRAHYLEYDWLVAEQLYRRAISLAEHDASHHYGYATFLRHTGRLKKALEYFYRARELGSEAQDLASRIVNTHAYMGQFAEARAFHEAEAERVGLENMRGNEAYFVSLLAEGMETEAREFAALDIPGITAPIRIKFFLARLDGDPEAAARLMQWTVERIERRQDATPNDIENLLLAGEVELAREHRARVAWAVPSRLTLFVNEEVDPRYLPFRPNLLNLLDSFPGAQKGHRSIGVDVKALAREAGFLK